MVTPTDETFVLPKEIVVQVLSFVRTPRTIGMCAAVCRLWRDAAAQPEIWQGMCLDRFGTAVACPETVNQHYQGDWRLMLQDDCRQAALPTCQWNGDGLVCPWRYNGQDQTAPRFGTFNRAYYACWIECIKWHRTLNVIRVHVEARGEMDLRTPQTSTLCVRRDGPLGGRRKEVRCRGRWVSELSEQRRGHYKGYMEYPDTFFEPHHAGYICEFRFASLGFRFIEDYAPVAVLHLPSDTTATTTRGFLEQVFLKGKTGTAETPRHTLEYSLDVSPFANDCPETERERWLKIFPPQVLDRGPVEREGRPPWWSQS